MTGHTTPKSRALHYRLLLALLACVPFALLLTALQLEPSSAGLGTHVQLGMPECGVLRTFGFRCPTCGMTTAWAHAVRGEWRQAAAANIAGLMLALLAPLAGAWLLAIAATGRWCYLRSHSPLVLGLLALVVGVGLVDWFVRVLPYQ